ncbi:SDR family oxidoreductase [Nocardioides jejuensis]|uniref:SDR family oxidoreductase n=1 Tax=Nocardioides jejuensis TaxID=2502782 RepID=A0A4R1CI67_9ACTN|nr:SDR family oxidoreductase [Nocardioides jejuensis]TCJ31000.1 SDR family oxidoreductase [Nocardioides jejuensis]
MPTVLITGASRGIGRTTSLRLAAAGWDVLAGVRREEDGAELVALDARITPVLLDITDAEQIARVAAEVTTLDALVNNAGVAKIGPLEGLSVATLREQMEINLIGQLAVTQALLPQLRASRGRIVFTSSLSGRVATPLTGAYNASKFALEGAADALRMELRPWGIRVSLVEPAQVSTDIWHNADADLDEVIAGMSPAAQELYRPHLAGFRKMIPLSQKLAVPADKVARAIEKAITSRSPRARYVVGFGPKAQVALSGTTPTPVLDAVLRKATGVPAKA